MAGQPQTSSYTAAAPRRGIFNLLWGVVVTILSAVWTMICATGASLSALMNQAALGDGGHAREGRGIIAVCGIKVEIEGLENLAGPQIVRARYQSSELFRHLRDLRATCRAILVSSPRKNCSKFRSWGLRCGAAGISLSTATRAARQFARLFR